MRIIYSGVFLAAVMQIDEGILWLFILTLVCILGIIVSVCGLMRYIRLKRRGIRVRARIVKREKREYYRNRHREATYIYWVDGVPYQCEVNLSFPYKKYGVRKTLDICCDPENPYRHIIVPNTLWQCIGSILISVLFSAGFLVLLLRAFRRSF